MTDLPKLLAHPAAVRALLDCARAQDKAKREFRDIDPVAALAELEAKNRARGHDSEADYWREVRLAFANFLTDPALARLHAALGGRE